MPTCHLVVVGQNRGQPVNGHTMAGFGRVDSTLAGYILSDVPAALAAGTPTGEPPDEG